MIITLYDSKCGNLVYIYDVVHLNCTVVNINHRQSRCFEILCKDSERYYYPTYRYHIKEIRKK